MEKQEKQLLTPLELKVMNILWQLDNAFVKEIIAEWPDQQNLPKYNTISTIVRILEQKGYVNHESKGRSHFYFPTLTKGRYQKRVMGNVLENVFSGSLKGLVSTLLDQEKVSKDEIEELKKWIDDNDRE